MNQPQDYTLDNLTDVFKAANRAKLDPTWTTQHDEVLLDCPQCKQDGTKARCNIRIPPFAGGLVASCKGCDDNTHPGIIGLLEIVGRPPGNLIPLHPERNGHPQPDIKSLGIQSWRAFEETAGEEVTCIIKGLWPEGALGFIGAAPKAGKTWLGIDIAISVATGTPVFGAFPVPIAVPVLYVALEGHRSAIRTRIGCIARGHGIHPEDHGLDLLHLAYKPKGINLADPSWAQALCNEALTLGARFVIIDVLRRAATIKENDASSFMELVDLLNPISEANISLAMLHHFNKINEMTTTRTPAERMAGSGAMFGALDVGLFITKSEGGARKLEVHTDIRDLAAPPKCIITLQGEGSGPHGGFTYHDNLRLVLEDAPPKEPEKAPASAIKAFITSKGGTVYPREIKDHFNIKDPTLKERREALISIGVLYISDGSNSRYEVPNTPPQTAPNPPLDTPNLGVPQTLPLAPNPLRGDGGARGQDGSAPGNPANLGAVNLTDEDDTGYWAMLNAITDPEAKEHE